MDEILPDFWHILCPSRAILCLGGIFPCFGLRKSLKTGVFDVLEFYDVYCRWSRLRERVSFLVENHANNI